MSPAINVKAGATIWSCCNCNWLKGNWGMVEINGKLKIIIREKGEKKSQKIPPKTITMMIITHQHHHQQHLYAHMELITSSRCDTNPINTHAIEIIMLLMSSYCRFIAAFDVAPATTGVCVLFVDL
jgi:hypothetical protein